MNPEELRESSMLTTSAVFMVAMPSASEPQSCSSKRGSRHEW